MTIDYDLIVIQNQNPGHSQQALPSDGAIFDPGLVTG